MFETQASHVLIPDGNTNVTNAVKCVPYRNWPDTFHQLYLVYFSSDENKYPIKKQGICVLVWILFLKFESNKKLKYMGVRWIKLNIIRFFM